MIQRVRQFAAAVTARLSEDEAACIRQTLPPDALALFFAMHPADRLHAFRVAKTALQLRQTEHEGDVALLWRAALLHDVGREKGDLDVWGKVFCVLAMRTLPCLSRKIACKKGPLPFRAICRALYVYLHHPEIGAERLRAIGLFKEAEIVAQHHVRPIPEQPPELRLLCLADERN